MWLLSPYPPVPLIPFPTSLLPYPHHPKTLQTLTLKIMDPAHKTLTLTVPNGTLNRHHHHHHHHHQQQQQAVYRECLKNHAASLGGHSLDGCGEFMASPSSDPSDPTSLTCAACGCHRNFHRRLPFLPLPPPLPQPFLLQDEDDNNEDDDDDEDGSEDERREDADGETGDNNNSRNYINSSVPHMLIALSTAAAAGTAEAGTTQQQEEQRTRSRKRFRTRFSPEQKERMQDLSERLGWRMQKRDEGLVEERCREIGVGKGVFKVWMHNNKHNFVPRSPSAALASSLLPPLTAASSLAIPTVSAMSTLAADGGIVNGVGNARANGPGGSAAS